VKPNGPWLKLYAEFIDNPKIRKLPDKLQIRYIYWLCLAKRGHEHESDQDISFRLHLSVKEVRATRKALTDAGLLDQDGSIHDWEEAQAPSESVERVRRYRSKHKPDGNADVTRYGNGVGNAHVTADIDIDIEGEVDEEIGMSEPAAGPDPTPAPTAAPPSVEAELTAGLLRDLILGNDPRARVPAHDSRAWHSWLTDLDRLHRIDGRPWPEIERIVRWSQADEFWRGNIISAGSLRKQFGRLLLQADRAPTTRSGRNRRELAATMATLKGKP